METRKYKVVATRSQLESIGISTDITDMEVELKHDYETGYLAVETTVEHVFGTTCMEFDVPETFLKEIE